MKKIILCFLLLLIIPFKVYADDVLDLAPNAKSSILVEQSTGEIIYERNIHERYSPASMTKMMSMLLFLEAIESNVMKWDEKITISERASSFGGSQILLETGEVMSVKDLFKGVAVGSGNDITVVESQSWNLIEI